MNDLMMLKIAWVLSPFVFIPILINMSSKIKQKDEEIRRLKMWISQLRNSETADNPAADGAENHIFSADDITEQIPPEITLPKSAPVYRQPVGGKPQPAENTPQTSRTTAQPARTTVQTVKAAAQDIKSAVQRPAKPTSENKFETSHLLFGVGVILVFVAGLIFATSMWKIMPPVAKVLTLLLAAAFFVSVALILEKKLKLREASITMYVLGSAFTSLISIAIGYFAWFGKSFSLGSSSRYLVISVSLWILSAMLYSGYRLYKGNVFTIIAFLTSLPAFALLARYVCGRGELALLFTGLYVLASLILTNRKDNGALTRLSQYISLAYVVLSAALYAEFGFIACMSLVMILCIVILIYLAMNVKDKEGKEKYEWIYYAIPIYGVLFVYNTSMIFKVSIPHGDTFCGIILGTAMLFTCRYVSIKGEKRLYNYASLGAVLISYIFFFTRFISVMEQSQDKVGDLREILPCIIVFLLSVLAFTAEYVHTLKPIRTKDAYEDTMIYMILLAALSFTGTYSMMPLARYSQPEEARYIGSIIPLMIISAIMLAVFLLYRYRLASETLSFRLVFTDRLGSVMLNISIVIAFIFFMSLSVNKHTSYILCIPLIAVTLMYQVHIRLKRHNPEGIITAAILPFVLIKGIEMYVMVMISGSEATKGNTAFELCMGMFLCILIIGLFVYRRIVLSDEIKKKVLIDWNILMSFIILMAAVIGGNLWGIEHKHFKSLIGFAIFLLYIGVRLSDILRKVIFSMITLLLCGAYAAQNFIAWNPDFKTELMAFSIPIFAAVIHFIIFKRKERSVSYISFGLMSLFFFIEWWNINNAASVPAMPVINTKLTIFLLVTVGVCLLGYLTGEQRYDILGLCLTVLLTASSVLNRRDIHLLLASAVCIALIVYYYRKRYQPLTIVPLIILLAVIHDTIYRRVMHYPAAGSFDMFFRILFKAEGDFTVPCIIWVGIFAVMLALGRFFHKKIFIRSNDKHGLVIDWFTILSIVPVINVLIVGNSKLRWSVLFLIVIYLFGYYRRVADEFNKLILTAISVLIATAWWTQPMIKVNELFVTELRITGFLALVYVVTRIIYKKELEGGEYSDANTHAFRNFLTPFSGKMISYFENAHFI